MLNYGTPFGYLFQDRHWFKKLVIASLLTYTVIGAAPVMGWTIEITRRVAQGITPLIPEFDDWKRDWQLGGKFALVNVLWLLPLLLVSLLLYAVPALLIGTVQDETVLIVFGGVLMCVLGFLFIFSWLYMFFIQPMVVSLALGGSVWQSANPAHLWRRVRPRFWEYFLVFIIIWLAVINLLLLVSSFTIFLLLPAALVYGGLVTAHFAGQLAQAEPPA